MGDTYYSVSAFEDGSATGLELAGKMRSFHFQAEYFDGDRETLTEMVFMPKQVIS